MTDNSSESDAIARTKNNRRFKDKVSKQWAVFCGDCGPLRDYIASKSFKSSWAIVKFLDALFRGYGQVVFANNPISGILVFIGLTVADPIVSAAGLLTACVGLLVSIVVLPQPNDVIANGLTVFNPLLVGLITAGLLPAIYGIELEYWHFFYMVVTAVICVYVTAAIGNILNSISRHPLPYLSLPFNVVQQLLFLLLISIAPTRIDNSTTTVEPQLLNHSLSHEPLQNVPIIPPIFVVPDRLILTKDTITKHPHEWSDVDELSQIDPATEEFTDELEGNSHKTQKNVSAIEHFEGEERTGFKKPVSENSVKLHVVSSSNFSESVHKAINSSLKINKIPGTQSKEKQISRFFSASNKLVNTKKPNNDTFNLFDIVETEILENESENPLKLQALATSKTLLNIDETNNDFTVNLDNVPVTESRENVNKDVTKLYAFIISHMTHTENITDNSTNDLNLKIESGHHSVTSTDTLIKVDENTNNSATSHSNVINGNKPVRKYVIEDKVKSYSIPSNNVFHVDKPEVDSARNYTVILGLESLKDINEETNKLHAVTSSNMDTNINKTVNGSIVHAVKSIRHVRQDSVTLYGITSSNIVDKLHELVNITNSLMHDTVKGTTMSIQEELNERKISSNLQEDLLNDSKNSLEPEDPSNGHQAFLATNKSYNNFLDLDNGERHFQEKRSVADEELLDMATVFNNSYTDEKPSIEVDWGGVFSGIVLSMSQAYACNYAPTSVLIYLAVLIYSPITAGFGVVGATVGTVAGVYLTEADTYAAAGGVYDGSWGFNGVLAGMCLGGLFFVISWSAAAITILCALFSSLLQYVFLPSFTRADLLVMTMPFNISALLFLCVTSRNLVRPRAISFPENQLREYRKHDHDEDSQDQLSSTSGNELDKDLEVEKKLAQTEVV